MTKYLQSTPFSVGGGGEKYAEGWDRIFKKKCDGCHGCEEPCGREEKAMTLPTTPSKSDIRQQVEEFAKAFGHPVGAYPRVPSDSRVRLRLRLIMEEFFELLEACGYYATYQQKQLEEKLEEWTPIVDSLAEVADALGDLDYVIEGMRLELGINGKPIADEIHRSNMSKLGTDGKPVVREDGKVMKGPNYSPPDIEREIAKQKGDV